MFASCDVVCGADCSTCGRCMMRMDHHCRQSRVLLTLRTHCALVAPSFSRHHGAKAHWGCSRVFSCVLFLWRCCRCFVAAWVNNCVAMFNQKYFLLFLLYTCLCCLYSGALLVGRFVSCTQNLQSCSVSGVQALLAIATFIEAIIFGLFCSIMLWDQLSAIFDNTPGIDALQDRHGDSSQGKYALLQEVFGEPLCWRWWLPLALPPKVAADFSAELEQLEDPLLEQMQNEHEQQDAAAAGEQQQQQQQRQQKLQQDAFQRSMHDMHAGSAGPHHHHQSQHQQHPHAARTAPLPAAEPQSIAELHQRATAGAASSISSSSSSRSRSGSSANRNNGNGNGSNGSIPIVFPDGYTHGGSGGGVERDANDPLAALQSPPHSPTFTGKGGGLAPRHVAATRH